MVLYKKDLLKMLLIKTHSLKLRIYQLEKDPSIEGLMSTEIPQNTLSKHAVVTKLQAFEISKQFCHFQIY